MNNRQTTSKLLKCIQKHRISLLGTAGCLAAALLILSLGIRAYTNYKEELTATEQNQLLTMARTIGKSLVTSVELELDSLDLYYSALESDAQAATEQNVTRSARSYLEKKGALYDAVACFDESGALIFQHGSMDFSGQFLPGESHAVICGKRLFPGGWYQMYIARKVRWEQVSYHLVYAMNLNEIYRRIVAPVQIGSGGYSIVKDSSLMIIMHHAQDQIGIDAVYGRSVRYPQLDLSDLFSWIELQKSRPEGVGLIHSYVWDDPDLTPEQRIVAYTTIELPGETWIVNSTLPYQELNQPLSRMLTRLAGICMVFIGLLSMLIILITRSLVRSDGQKREIAYLKEINEGMELLRHKEEEIQHYQRVQSIGQMSSHIAHEFNNYLTPVMVYGELLENDDTISPENQELIRGILKSANQAADLSRRLLDFSRQDSSVALTSIDLTADVRDAVFMIRQLAPQKIQVLSDLNETPLLSRGRRGMIEHILMNLCNNAFHAMEERGGALTIRLAPAARQDFSQGLSMIGTAEYSEHTWAMLSVRDTGSGISPDALDKIFEPFYTTKRSGKGTGLGLSVIRNIMTAVGGQLRIETEPGKGTCFFLFFPLEEEAALDSGGGKRRGPGGPVRRIAVVDDDPELLKSLRTMFQGLDCKAEFFDHPAAVISRIQNQPEHFDALLTDYSMPSMNGLELCELIRKLNPKIRLLLMSGMEDVRFAWYLKNEFINEFVLKTDLGKRLGEILKDGDGQGS